MQKADEDTFVRTPLLRAFLAGHDPAQPVYLGRRLWSGRAALGCLFRRFWPASHGYCLCACYCCLWLGRLVADNASFVAGGSGIVLSRAALSQLGASLAATVGDVTADLPAAGHEEDVELARVLRRTGLFPADTRDAVVRPRPSGYCFCWPG